MKLIGRTQSGMAVVESLLLSLVLLVPIVWMLGVLAEVHRVTLAATAAVRDAGSSVSVSGDPVTFERQIATAASSAFRSHDLDPSMLELEWSGTLQRGGRVKIELSYPVTVLQMPFIGSLSGPSIWISAEHTAPIQKYLSRE